MNKTFDYNSISPNYYDKIYKNGFNPQKFWHHFKFEYIKNLIDLSGNTSLLDLGCGSGTFLNTFNEAELKYGLGVDISNQQINYANEHNENNKIEFKAINVTKENLEIKNKFDIITIIEVIEHLNISEIKLLLESSKKLLKENGKILLTTPNYASFWSILEFIVNLTSKQSYKEQHITKFTKKKLAKLLDESGYSLDMFKSFLGISPFLTIFGENFARKIYNLENKTTKLKGNLLIAVITPK